MGREIIEEIRNGLEDPPGIPGRVGDPRVGQGRVGGPKGR